MHFKQSIENKQAEPALPGGAQLGLPAAAEPAAPLFGVFRAEGKWLINGAFGPRSFRILLRKKTVDNFVTR